MSKQEFQPITTETRKRFFEQFTVISNRKDEELNENYLFTVHENNYFNLHSIQRRYWGFSDTKERGESRKNEDSPYPFHEVTELVFENGDFASLKQSLNHEISSSRRVHYVKHTNGFSIALEIAQRHIHDAQVRDFFDNEDRIQVNYDESYRAGEITIIERDTYKLGEKSVFGVFGLDDMLKRGIQTFSQGDASGFGNFELKIHDKIIEIAFDSEYFSSTSKAPLYLNVERINQTLFPDEVAIPEAEVPSLRKKLGTSDVPFARPVLFSNPRINRSDFPKDVHGNVIDLDRVWRSIDLAGLIGLDIHRAYPDSQNKTI